MARESRELTQIVKLIRVNSRHSRATEACIRLSGLASFCMALPEQPVTLTVEQIVELNQKLSHLRHDINGDLALVVAAAELIKLNPELKEKMMATLLEQPPKIRERCDKF